MQPQIAFAPITIIAAASEKWDSNGLLTVCGNCILIAIGFFYAYDLCPKGIAACKMIASCYDLIVINHPWWTLTITKAMGFLSINNRCTRRSRLRVSSDETWFFTWPLKSGSRVVWNKLSAMIASLQIMDTREDVIALNESKNEFEY